MADRASPTKAQQRVALQMVLLQRERLDLNPADLSNLSRSYGVAEGEVERMAAQARQRREVAR